MRHRVDRPAGGSCGWRGPTPQPREGRGIKPRPPLCLGHSPRRSLTQGANQKVQRHHQPTTIAILGCDTVVGRSLSVLLESSGYQTYLLESYPTGVVDELLDGVHLLILTPRV